MDNVLMTFIRLIDANHIEYIHSTAIINKDFEKPIESIQMAYSYNTNEPKNQHFISKWIENIRIFIEFEVDGVSIVKKNYQFEG